MSGRVVRLLGPLLVAASLALACATMPATPVESASAATPAPAPQGTAAPEVSAATAAVNPMAIVQAGAAASARGDHRAAEQAYRALAEAFPTLPGAMAALGRALASQGKVEDGLGWLERAAATGAATDLAALRAALGPAADQPRGAAVVARFTANLEPLVRSTTLLNLADKHLLPESLAHDPTDGTLYVGSMYRRKVIAVRDGAVRDFVPATSDGIGSVLGMKIHPARHELWVNSCHSEFRPTVAEPDPARLGEAAVHRYSLPGGKLVAVHRTGTREARVCFNDLAFGPEGDAFLTSGDGGVWRVGVADGTLERFVATPGHFVNGIAAAAGGRALYLADALRGVVVLDLATRALRPLPGPEGTSLVGIDGLYVWRNSLVGVQNGLSAAGPERVVQAFLSADGSRVECVEVLERSHPEYAVPTTGAVVGGELWYVAASGLNRLDAEQRPLPVEQLRETAILSLPLVERCGGVAP